MGNKKAREFMKKKEIQDALDSIKTTYRDIYDDVLLPGLGYQRIQLLYVPSFEDAKWWEIRQLKDEWQLYRSRVVYDHVENCEKLIDYEKISIRSNVLQKYFEKACEISISIKPLLTNTIGLDGNTTEFSIPGDVSSCADSGGGQLIQEIGQNWWH